jgi:hypothetical protein
LRRAAQDGSHTCTGKLFTCIPSRRTTPAQSAGKLFANPATIVILLLVLFFWLNLRLMLPKEGSILRKPLTPLGKVGTVAFDIFFVFFLLVSLIMTVVMVIETI